MTTLTRKTCRECQKSILVAEYEPHPLEKDATGMPAYRWDSDRQQDYFVGWICEECALERVGESLPSMISGSGPTLHFYY
jgi:hypothetical protein